MRALSRPLPWLVGAAAVRLARAAAEEEVLRTRPRPRAAGAAPALAERRGAFVSVLHAGALRGCMGRPEPAEPLGGVVA